MTAIIIISILLLLFYFWISRPSSGNIQLNVQNNYRKDDNYEHLKKLFLSASLNNINCPNLINSRTVYGLLIETHLNDNLQIMLGTYITGFAGYYLSRGGGLIGGKWHEENDPFLQQELMQLSEFRNLTGEFQSADTRNLATNLTYLANEFVDMSNCDINSWPVNSNTINIWLLTTENLDVSESIKVAYHSMNRNSPQKQRIFFAQVDKAEFQNSNLKLLITKSFELIMELNKFEGSINARQVSDKLNLLYSSIL
jgi:hypothetical protein